MSHAGLDVCEHDRLRRQCETCDAIAERDHERARVSAVCEGANELWLWHSARIARLRAVARAVIALDAGGYAMHPDLVPLIRALTPGDLEDPT